MSNDWVTGDQQFYQGPADVDHCDHFMLWDSKNSETYFYSYHKTRFKHNKRVFQDWYMTERLDEPDYGWINCPSPAFMSTRLIHE